MLELKKLAVLLTNYLPSISIAHVYIYIYSATHAFGREGKAPERGDLPKGGGGVWRCSRPLFLHLAARQEVSDLTVSLLERRWGGGRGAVVAMRSCGHQSVCKNNTSLLSIHVDLTIGSSVYIA